MNKVSDEDKVITRFECEKCNTALNSRLDRIDGRTNWILGLLIASLLGVVTDLVTTKVSHKTEGTHYSVSNEEPFANCK